ncbi:MAG: glycosyltransferase family 9 protein [Bacteroidales bacterium]
MGGILILRLSAIGDVAMTVHAVRALRAAYPDLPITIGTRERLSGFFNDVPNVQFLYFPKQAGFKELRSYVSAAKASKFDYVADLQSNLRTGYIRFMLALSGCKVAYYAQKSVAKWRIKRRFFKRLQPVRNNVLRFCDVFAKLGFPVPDPKIVRKVLPVPSCFGSKEGTWIGIAPFSRKEKKIYPLDSCSELIRLVSLRFDKVFVFSGPGEELNYCESMMRLYPNVETVFGRTDLAGETALISNLDALVTMDSATMHMATLTGAPFVAVWGGTHPATGYSAYGADWDKNYVQLDMPCRPCSSYGEGNCRFGDFRCLMGISPDTILSKITALIGYEAPDPDSGSDSSNGSCAAVGSVVAPSSSDDRSCSDSHNWPSGSNANS